jgi:hypothetical protein
MSFLSKMVQQLKRDGLEPDECLVCVQPTNYTDALGLSWCEEHEHHGKVLTWGHWHKFPELHFGRYALGPDDASWWAAVVGSARNSVNKGNEDFMWTALIYLEDLDRQEVVS